MVKPSNHLILCHPLLLLSSIVPSTQFSSNESALLIRWPKYWSFSFSISPSNECSRLISFRNDWFDLLAVQGTLKSLLQRYSSKASILRCSAFIFQLSHPYMTTGKSIALTRRTFVGKVMSRFLICCLGWSFVKKMLFKAFLWPLSIAHLDSGIYSRALSSLCSVFHGTNYFLRQTIFLQGPKATAKTFPGLNGLPHSDPEEKREVQLQRPQDCGRHKHLTSVTHHVGGFGTRPREEQSCSKVLAAGQPPGSTRQSGGFAVWPHEPSGSNSPSVSTRRPRKQTYGCRGKGWLGSLGKSCTLCCVQNG